MRKFTSFTILCVMICLSAVAFVGCKKIKKETNEVAAPIITQDDIDSLQAEVNMLKNELAVYDDSYKSSKSFRKKSVLNAGLMQFNKIADKIVLDGSLTNVDDFSAGANNGIIKLGNSIEIDPSGWTTKISSDTVEFCYENHASGKIYTKKFIGEGNFPSQFTIDYYIDPYLKANGVELKNTRNLFLNNNVIGQEGSGNISVVDTTKYSGELTVDATQILDESSLSDYKLGPESSVNIKIALSDDLEKDAKLRIGIAKYNSVVLCYEFICYDNPGETLTTNLIRSITINNGKVHVE